MLTLAFTLPLYLTAQSPDPLLANVADKEALVLDGTWNYIVDPYHTGYRDSPRYDFPEYIDAKGNFVEYGFQAGNTLKVPGDWNTQRDELLYYENLLWYQRSFMAKKRDGKRYVLYFGAANYRADVYMNGEKLGSHEGGFTPFNFEVTDELKNGDNYLVVAVNNQRKEEYVPTLKTDWWNYGGLTRSVKLIELPDAYIRDYKLQLKKGGTDRLYGWVQLSDSIEQNITLEIPELKVKKQLSTDAKGHVDFELRAKPILWSPENPKLYDVLFQTETDTVTDRIGFRTIGVKGQKILLNGRPIFLKGISIHEEAPYGGGRVSTADQSRQLLEWAKELGCNYVRLAHYPHNEAMVRQAEEMGLMVWSEIPVYWNILWENGHSYRIAEQMLDEMITRDRNRANIIIWSVANETPKKEARTVFLKKLIDKTREMDPERLVSAALHEVRYDKTTHTKVIEDDLAEYVDILSVNNYCGWYQNSDCASLKWATAFKKPMIMSEFGGGALQGLYGKKDERWTEKFQAEIYRQHVQMFDGIGFLAGTSPWILKDFKSPLRMLPGIQDQWNRKGLISEEGIRKQAFFVLQGYYQSKE